jgi:alkanesulfonate monooxygenase SsuD/methylene tetrahydromethanopterin reductase-like flavin-dependent oxidoreductase (luciferase family)
VTWGDDVKLSVSLTNFSWPGDPRGLRHHMAWLAGRLDESRVDTLWVADHLVQADPASSFEEPMLEAYTTLGFLAGTTTRIRLGTMVTAATHRPPALLIEAVTTLDVLSEGRAWLGVGAGYQQQEARVLGLDLPPLGEHYDRMVDLVLLAKQMWAGDETPFRGHYVYAERPTCQPQPLARPHPRLLIGGAGERRTLRLVAEHGDACNLFDIPDAGRTVRRKLEALAAHCADVGRPYGQIETTVNTVLQRNESPGQLLDRVEALKTLGIHHAVFVTRGRPWSRADLETVATTADELASAR